MKKNIYIDKFVSTVSYLQNYNIIAALAAAYRNSKPCYIALGLCATKLLDFT